MCRAELSSFSEELRFAFEFKYQKESINLLRAALFVMIVTARALPCNAEFPPAASPSDQHLSMLKL